MASIRLLEAESNRRGDLFGRLMADVFIALGYEQPRLNIHKSGREVDLSATHRLEPRKAIAECKAISEPIGGDDLNKFVGGLDAEQSSDPLPLTGYFISLSGFRETAIEQERHRRTKIVTINGPQVVAELIRGRIVISKEAAAEISGACRAGQDHLVPEGSIELLAHERGWIWAVYYGEGKKRTHFVLVHADGTLLASSLVAEIVSADRDCGGALHLFSCLNPPPKSSSTDEVRGALEAYRRYLIEELGYIQLDGLPADNDVGSRRLRLENLFVPTNIDILVGKDDWERYSIGTFLAERNRLALLAPPGGGKSTVLKRLGVAYADSTRRNEIDDRLPDRDWLPLFFRCRELRGLARGSFSQILDALSDREPVRPHAEVFRAHVDRELLAGRVLLLVDGLDEISDSGDRAAFVSTLRTALQAYPDVGIVVTSREAGFRHVAAHLSGVCEDARLSSFDETDIRSLCVSWHKEVLGDSRKVVSDAKQLAADIVSNDRIHRLAVNPLLLTTLLLVKRWVGSLPTRRTVLYSKAVEVLLMTWNTEGHDPIPEDEALPQLCFVAASMMLEGVQKISRPQLRSRLQEAREALPTELGYVRGTVEDFIHRVEDRSSLLMMTGHDVEDGLLVEFFEFRHLTFQEFLTARALVEGWHPQRSDSDTLLSVLTPYLRDEKWREVVPLAAVLGGKATEGLIQLLTTRVEALPLDNEHNREDPNLINLANCLADEAPAKPSTIQAAIKQVVRFGFHLHNGFSDRLIAQGRYGSDFRAEARRAFTEPTPDFVNSRYALLSAAWWQTLKTADEEGFLDAAKHFADGLDSDGCVERCEGALGLIALCFEHRRDKTHIARGWSEKFLPTVHDRLAHMVFSAVPQEQHVASWALGLMGMFIEECPTPTPQAIGRFYELWQRAEHEEVRHLAGWAIAASPVGNRDDECWRNVVRAEDFRLVAERYEEAPQDFEERLKTTILHLAWYLRTPWSDSELRERASVLFQETGRKRGESIDLQSLALRDLLNYLPPNQPAERLRT